MRMTRKELVISQIEHIETTPVPYVLGFEEGCGIELKLDDYFGTSRWRAWLDNAVISLPVVSRKLVFDRRAEEWTDLYGSRWRPATHPSEPVEHALKEPSLKGFSLPKVDELIDGDWQDRALRQIGNDRDHFHVALCNGHFETMWLLRGFENSLTDMVLHVLFIEKLMEFLTDHFLQIVEKELEIPVDGVMFSDDWGYQEGVIMGAERWRKLFKPHLARLYGAVHKAGRFVITHCDGSIGDILPDLIEIGLDVYQSVQPEARNNSPYNLKREYGRDITFWGGLGSQALIPFGTPREIKDEVRKLCHRMGEGGGYILGPSKEFQPETPVENAAAVVEAFLEQSGRSPGSPTLRRGS